MKLKELLSVKRNKWILAVVLAITVGVTGTAAFVLKKNTVNAEMQITSIETANVMRQDLAKSISLNGTIAALESQSVASELSGVKINSLKVRVGDRVKKGDVIAVLDTTTIENTLKQAEEALEIAKKKDALELATAKRNYDSAVEAARIQEERAKRDSEKARDEYDKAVAAANTASAESTSATDNANELSAAAAKAKDDMGAAGKDADSAGDRLGDAQSAYEAAGKNEQEAKEAMEDAMKAYTELVNGDLTDAKERKKKATNSLNKAEEKLKNAEKDKTELDNSEDATDEQKEEAQKVLDSAKDNKIAAEGAAKEASDAYDALIDKADKLKDKADKAKEKYDKSAKKLEKNEKKLGKVQKENEAANNELERTQNYYEEQQNALAEAKAKQAEAEAEAKTTKENIGTAKDSQIKAEEAEADQIREGTKTVADSKDSYAESELSKGANTIAAQQEVDKYRQELEKGTVTAPCDGLVTAVGVKEGAIYDNGREIALIQDDSGYKVTASVDQYDICDISTGMKVLIRTDSMGDEEMEGTLSFVSPIPGSVAQGASGSDSGSTQSGGNDYPIEVSINDKTDRLRIGMTAKITITEKESAGALTVPDTCVQQAEDGSYYVEKAVRDENGNVCETGERITVTYGVKTDYYVEIKGEGVEDGMEVLIPTQDYGTDEISID